MSHLISSAPECAAACPLAAALPSGLPSTVDRRTFLSQAVLAAAATALAACGSSSSADTTAPTSINGSINVAAYTKLTAIGGAQAVSINGQPVAIVRTGTSSFVALWMVCPHKGTQVNIVSSGFYCPNHGAQFNATGTWTGGQSTSSLRSYPTSYDAATGVLTIG